MGFPGTAGQRLIGQKCMTHSTVLLVCRCRTLVYFFPTPQHVAIFRPSGGKYGGHGRLPVAGKEGGKRERWRDGRMDEQTLRERDGRGTRQRGKERKTGKWVPTLHLRERSKYSPPVLSNSRSFSALLCNTRAYTNERLMVRVEWVRQNGCIGLTTAPTLQTIRGPQCIYQPETIHPLQLSFAVVKVHLVRAIWGQSISAC